MSEIEGKVRPMTEVSLPTIPGERSETGYTPSENLPFEEWLEVLKSLASEADTESRKISALCWAVADLLAFGSYRYGEKWRRAHEVLGGTWTIATMKQMGIIASRFEKLSRLNDVPFWHYQAIAQLEDPDQRLRVLEQAAAEGWSQRKIKSQVRHLRLAAAEDEDGSRAEGDTHSGTDEATTTEETEPAEGDAGSNQTAGDAEASQTSSSAASSDQPADEDNLADFSAHQPLPRRQPELVIIAVPEWKLTPDGDGMGVDVLLSRVEDDSPDDAICFLRAPPTRLSDGMAVLRAWGFSYLTSIAADLPNPAEHVDANLWFKATLDFVLIGVRGGLPEVPDDELMWDRPIGQFVRAALLNRVAGWLPDVEVRVVE